MAEPATDEQIAQALKGDQPRGAILNSFEQSLIARIEVEEAAKELALQDVARIQALCVTETARADAITVNTDLNAENDRLRERIAALERLLGHAHHRTHDGASEGCTPCCEIRDVLGEGGE